MAAKKTLTKNGVRERQKARAHRERVERVKRALRRQRQHAIEPGGKRRR